MHSLSLRFATACLAAGLLSAAVVPARAATFAVTKSADTADGNCNVDCSLREAIAAANAAAGPDEVVVPAGVYALAIAGRQEDAAGTGDLDVQDSVTIRGAGADVTTIDAQGIDRVIHVIGAPVNFTVTLSGITLRGGLAPENPFGEDQDGGGVLVEQGTTVVLDRTRITDNEARSYGGGLAVQGSSVTVLDSTLDANEAHSGAAMNVSGASMSTTCLVEVERSGFSDNVAVGYGGAVYVHPSCFFKASGSVFRANRTSFDGEGGAVYANDRVELSRTLLEGNEAGEVAGALALWVVSLDPPSRVSDCTFRGNTAEYEGGAIYQAAGALVVEGSTFTGNRGRDGSAIASAPLLTLLNSTVSENPTNDLNGSEIYTLFTGATAISSSSIVGTPDDLGTTVKAQGLTTFSNSLVVGECGGNLHSLGGNLESPSDTCRFSPLLGDERNVADAKIGPLAENGGPTQTHALLAGSPAIDQGETLACPPTDQRGVERPQGARCDAGAFEVETGGGCGTVTRGAAVTLGAAPLVPAMAALLTIVRAARRRARAV